MKSLIFLSRIFKFINSTQNMLVCLLFILLNLGCLSPIFAYCSDCSKTATWNNNNGIWTSETPCPSTCCNGGSRYGIEQTYCGSNLCGQPTSNNACNSPNTTISACASNFSCTYSNGQCIQSPEAIYVCSTIPGNSGAGCSCQNV